MSPKTYRSAGGNVKTTYSRLFAVAAVLLMVMSAFCMISGSEESQGETNTADTSYSAKVQYSPGTISGVTADTTYNKYTANNPLTVTYNGNIISTEYNPQVWTLDSVKTARWFEIKSYSAGNTYVFAGWKLGTYSNGTITYSDTVIVDPGDVFTYENGKWYFGKTPNNIAVDGNGSGTEISTSTSDNVQTIYLQAKWEKINSYNKGSSFSNQTISGGSKYTNFYILTGNYSPGTSGVSFGNITIRSDSLTSYRTLTMAVCSLTNDAIIDNVNLNAYRTGGGSSHGAENQGLFANGYTFILGDGINTVLYNSDASTVSYLQGTVYGGKSGTINTDTKVIIHSGTYSSVVGGTANGTVNGDTKVVFKGGNILDTITASGTGSSTTNGSSYLYATGLHTYGDYYEENRLDSSFQGNTSGGVTIKSYESSIVTGGASSGTVKNTHIYISGNSIIWDVQAAGRGGDSKVTGTASIETSGNAVITHTMCGSITDGASSGNDRNCVKTVNLTVTGNAQVASVFGAGFDTFYEAAKTSMYGEEDSITINIRGGTVGYVYGGGYRGTIGTSSAPIGFVEINVSGGTILGDVYGGGRGGVDKTCHDKSGNKSWSESFEDFTGHSEIYTKSLRINVSGGTINGSVYGAGESVPWIDTTKYSSSFSKTYTVREDVATVHIVSDSSVEKNGVYIDVTGGRILNDVYGGGKGIDTESNYVPYTICMKDGAIVNVPWVSGNDSVTNCMATGTTYTNAYATYARVEGDINISVSNNATVGNVYGGGAFGVVVDSSSDVSISVDGNVTGNVYGGGKGKSTSNTLGQMNVSSVGVSIGTNGTVGGNVYGGGAYGTVTVSNSNKIPVSVSGTVTGSVFGAGQGVSTSQTVGKVTGLPEVTVRGTAGYVYGGGENAVLQTPSSTSIVKVTVSGHVTNDVFGGGKGISGNNVPGTVYGATDVRVTGTVDGNVYGGGSYGLVSPAFSGTATTVTLDGDASANNVFGGGYGELGTNSVYTNGYRTDSLLTVTGNARITGSAYGGAAFGIVNGNTDVVLEGGSVGGNVFGAGLGGRNGDTAYQSVTGTSTVRISNDSITVGESYDVSNGKVKVGGEWFSISNPMIIVDGKGYSIIDNALTVDVVDGKVTIGNNTYTTTSGITIDGKAYPVVDDKVTFTSTDDGKSVSIGNTSYDINDAIKINGYIYILDDNDNASFTATNNQINIAGKNYEVVRKATINGTEYSPNSSGNIVFTENNNTITVGDTSYTINTTIKIGNNTFKTNSDGTLNATISSSGSGTNKKYTATLTDINNNSVQSAKTSATWDMSTWSYVVKYVINNVTLAGSTSKLTITVNADGSASTNGGTTIDTTSNPTSCYIEQGTQKQSCSFASTSTGKRTLSLDASGSSVLFLGTSYPVSTTVDGMTCSTSGASVLIPAANLVTKYGGTIGTAISVNGYKYEVNDGSVTFPASAGSVNIGGNSYPIGTTATINGKSYPVTGGKVTFDKSDDSIFIGNNEYNVIDWTQYPVVDSKITIGQKYYLTDGKVSVGGITYVEKDGVVTIEGKDYAVKRVSIGGDVYGGSAEGRVTGESKVIVNGGTTNGSIFGAGLGNLGVVSNSSTSSVEFNYGHVKTNVYGGAKNGIVNGATQVTISNGTIDGNVFGAGLGDKKNATTAYVSVDDISEVLIHAGTIGGNVYGGSALGLVTQTSSVTVENGTIGGSVFGSGYGTLDIPSNTLGTSVVISGGSMQYAYGGAENGIVMGDTEVTITGSSVNVSESVYGGGLGEAGHESVHGDSSVVLTDGTVSSIYGGAMLGYISGNSEVSINNSTVEGNVFGSGLGACGYLSTALTSTVTISNSTVFGNTYGGAENGYVTGTIYTVIQNNSTIKGSVFGAGLGAAENDTTAYPSASGDIDVTISGSTIGHNVYGGSALGLVGGDINMDLRGAHIGGTVYGGGLGTTGITSVNGSRYIHVSGNTDVGESIYGGSANGNDVKPEDSYNSNAFIYIESGTITGSIVGGGFKGETNGNTYILIGKYSYLDFDACKTVFQPEDNSDCVIQICESVYLGGDVGVLTSSSDAFKKVMVHGSGHLSVSGLVPEGKSGKSTITLGGSLMGSGNSCLTGDSGKTTTAYIHDIADSIVMESIHRFTDVTIEACNIELNGRATIIDNEKGATYLKDSSYSLFDIEYLYLKNSTTLILDGSVENLGEYSSLNDNGFETTSTSPFNKIVIGGGNSFIVRDVGREGPVYGLIFGYTVLSTRGDDSGYGSYALGSTSSTGGFVILSSGTYVTADHTDFVAKKMETREGVLVDIGCRCWFISGAVSNEITLTIGDSGEVSSSVFVPALQTGSSYRFTGSTYISASATDEYKLLNKDDVMTENGFKVRFGYNDGKMKDLLLFYQKDSGGTAEEGTYIEDRFGVDPVMGLDGGYVTSDTRIPNMLIHAEGQFTESKYIGYVIIYINEVKALEYKDEYGEDKVTYVIVNTIQTKVFIYSEAASEEVTAANVYVSTVNGNGSDSLLLSNYIVNSETHTNTNTAGFSVWVDSVSADSKNAYNNVSKITITAEKNQNSTLGWTTRSSTEQFTNGSSDRMKIGTMQGGYVATVSFYVEDFLGTEKEEIYYVVLGLYDGDTKVQTINVTVSVKAVPDVQVTFVIDQENNTRLTYSFNYGITISDADCPPTEGNFVGWYTDENFNNPFSFSTPLTKKTMTLYARYMYAVTLDYMDGTMSTVYVTMPGVIGPTIVPSRDGYTFGGWYTETDYIYSWDPEKDVVTGNMILYAKWTGWTVKIDFHYKVLEDGVLTDHDFTADITTAAGGSLLYNLMEFGSVFDMKYDFVINGTTYENMYLLDAAQKVLGTKTTLVFIYWVYSCDYGVTVTKTSAVYTDSFLKDVSKLTTITDGEGNTTYDTTDGVHHVSLCALLSDMAAEIKMDSNIYDDTGVKLDLEATVDPPSQFLVYPTSKTDDGHGNLTYVMEIEMNGATRPGYALTGWHIQTETTIVAINKIEYPVVNNVVTINGVNYTPVNGKVTVDGVEYPVETKYAGRTTIGGESGYTYTAGSIITLTVTNNNDTGDTSKYPYKAVFSIGKTAVQVIGLTADDIARLKGTGEIYDINFISKWDHIKYTITIAEMANGTIYAMDSTTGTVQNQGTSFTLYYGDQIDILFIANHGYEFNNWSITGEGLLDSSKSSSTIFTVRGDATIAAYVIGPQIVKVYVEVDSASDADAPELVLSEDGVNVDFTFSPTVYSVTDAGHTIYMYTGTAILGSHELFMKGAITGKLYDLNVEICSTTLKNEYYIVVDPSIIGYNKTNYSATNDFVKDGFGYQYITEIIEIDKTHYTVHNNKITYNGTSYDVMTSGEDRYVTINGNNYYVVEGTVGVSGYTGSSTDPVIITSITYGHATFTVNEILDGAFAENTTIKTVTFESVIGIEGHPFKGCSNLEAVYSHNAEGSFPIYSKGYIAMVTSAIDDPKGGLVDADDFVFRYKENTTTDVKITLDSGWYYYYPEGSSEPSAHSENVQYTYTILSGVPTGNSLKLTGRIDQVTAEVSISYDYDGSTIKTVSDAFDVGKGEGFLKILTNPYAVIDDTRYFVTNGKITYKGIEYTVTDGKVVIDGTEYPIISYSPIIVDGTEYTVSLWYLGSISSENLIKSDTVAPGGNTPITVVASLIRVDEGSISIDIRTENANGTWTEETGYAQVYIDNHTATFLVPDKEGFILTTSKGTVSGSVLTVDNPVDGETVTLTYTRGTVMVSINGGEATTKRLGEYLDLTLPSDTVAVMYTGWNLGDLSGSVTGSAYEINTVDLATYASKTPGYVFEVTPEYTIRTYLVTFITYNDAQIKTVHDGETTYGTTSALVLEYGTAISYNPTTQVLTIGTGEHAYSITVENEDILNYVFDGWNGNLTTGGSTEVINVTVGGNAIYVTQWIVHTYSLRIITDEQSQSSASNLSNPITFDTITVEGTTVTKSVGGLKYGSLISISIVFDANYSLDESKSSYKYEDGTAIPDITPVKGTSLQKYTISFRITGDSVFTIASKWVGNHLYFYIWDEDLGRYILQTSMTKDVGRNTTEYLKITDYEDMSDIHRAGYYFNGWFLDMDCTSNPVNVLRNGNYYYELTIGYDTLSLYGRYVSLVPTDTTAVYDGEYHSATFDIGTTLPSNVTFNVTFDGGKDGIRDVDDSDNGKDLGFTVTVSKVYNDNWTYNTAGLAESTKVTVVRAIAYIVSVGGTFTSTSNVSGTNMSTTIGFAGKTSSDSIRDTVTNLTYADVVLSSPGTKANLVTGFVVTYIRGSSSTADTYVVSYNGNTVSSYTVNGGEGVLTDGYLVRGNYRIMLVPGILTMVLPDYSVVKIDG